jgi:hypothetical protein
MQCIKQHPFAQFTARSLVPVSTIQQAEIAANNRMEIFGESS